MGVVETFVALMGESGVDAPGLSAASGEDVSSGLSAVNEWLASLDGRVREAVDEVSREYSVAALVADPSSGIYLPDGFEAILDGVSGQSVSEAVAVADEKLAQATASPDTGPEEYADQPAEQEGGVWPA